MNVSSAGPTLTSCQKEDPIVGNPTETTKAVQTLFISQSNITISDKEEQAFAVEYYEDGKTEKENAKIKFNAKGDGVDNGQYYIYGCNITGKRLARFTINLNP